MKRLTQKDERGCWSLRGLVSNTLKRLSDEKKKHQWIPITECLPESDDYILLSFENASFIEIGRYEEDEKGSGAFYPGDEDKSYAQYGIFVNAWMSLPEKYKG